MKGSDHRLRHNEIDAIARAFTLFEQTGIFEIISTPDLFVRFQSIKRSSLIILAPDGATKIEIESCFGQRPALIINESLIVKQIVEPRLMYVNKLLSAKVVPYCADITKDKTYACSIPLCM